ncbi:unnamed protein product [Darwinula stevensoni]|uniref:Uncharacterized protein n=1 Tax=Darwinula stevensoni TaxID=69355 RepID=A0A7R9A7Q5_9CRUS|nr:unnamed protein product [Darwinula stevensoni]CAG0893007.1 unnamed protein product [Darwinula stevensoni]
MDLGERYPDDAPSFYGKEWGKYKEHEAIRRRREGYLLTAPKVLRSNSTELICLSLFNLEGPGNAKLTLTGEGEDAFAATLDHSFTKGSKECVDFPVPNVPEQRGRLHLQLTLDGVPDYVGNESELVNIREYQNLLFVQTDKSLYLPGQDVRFRILVLDAALKPLDDQVRILRVNL